LEIARMIEASMYLGIGLLFGALICLVLIPLVHARAVRPTARRLEVVLPGSMAKVQTERDLLRADFAVSTRRLEITVEQLTRKTTSQVVELSKKNDIINPPQGRARRAGKSRSSHSRPMTANPITASVIPRARTIRNSSGRLMGLRQARR
jgi:hypothetical protein